MPPRPELRTPSRRRTAGVPGLSLPKFTRPDPLDRMKRRNIGIRVRTWKDLERIKGEKEMRELKMSLQRLVREVLENFVKEYDEGKLKK